MFKVVVTKRAEREFAKLPQSLKQKLYEELEKLTVNPYSHPKAKKLQEIKFGYRLRIGQWRILFALFSKEKRIEIVDIFLKKGDEDYFKRKGLI